MLAGSRYGSRKEVRGRLDGLLKTFDSNECSAGFASWIKGWQKAMDLGDYVEK